MAPKTDPRPSTTDPAAPPDTVTRPTVTRPTACVLCAANCGLLVDVDQESNRIVKVRADPDNPITRGHICHKGFTIDRVVQSADRVRSPLRRRPDGGFEEVSWDIALTDIADRLVAIRDEHGPRTIGALGLGGQANHLHSAFADLFLALVGSDVVYNAWAQEKTQNHLVDRWMCDAPTELFLEPDVPAADVVVLLGCNPKMSHMITADEMRRIERDPGRTLIVIDPRRTESARHADLHLALRPGTDAQLLAAIAAVIVQEDLVDHTWLARHARGAAETLGLFGALDVSQLAAVSDLPEADLRGAARLIAGGPATAIRPFLGVEHHRDATLVAWLIRVIAALTGDLGEPGGMTFHGSLVPRLSRFQRRRRHHTPVTGLEGIGAFGMRAAFSPAVVPDEILTSHPQRLRALFVEGSNPARSYPDSTRWAAALDALELLVVIDPVMTETARHAHYVLPCPVGYEKWEQAFFPRHWPEIHAQLRPPILAASAGLRTESAIHVDLAERMHLIKPPPRAVRLVLERSRGLGFGLLFAWALVSQRSIARANAAATMAAHRIVGPTLDDPALVLPWILCHGFALVHRGEVRRAGLPTRWRAPWTIGEALFDRLLRHPAGTVVATRDPARDLPRRVRLNVDRMVTELGRVLARDEVIDPELPFILTAGNRGRWTANTIQRDPDWRGKGPHGTLGLHPDDASALGIADEGRAAVTTATGRLELTVAFDDGLRRGHVVMQNVFGLDYPDEEGRRRPNGPNINLLAGSTRRDPFVGNPANKHIPCRVEPAGGIHDATDATDATAARRPDRRRLTG